MNAAVTQALDWFLSGFQAGLAIYAVIRGFTSRENSFFPLGLLSVSIALSGFFGITAAGSSPGTADFARFPVHPVVIILAVSSLCFAYTWSLFYDEREKRAWRYRLLLFALSILMTGLASYSGSPLPAGIGALPAPVVLLGTGLIEVFGASRRQKFPAAPYGVALCAYSGFIAAMTVPAVVPAPGAAQGIMALMTVALCCSSEARVHGRGKTASGPGTFKEKQEASGNAGPLKDSPLLSQKKYRWLFDGMTDGIFYTDREERIIECNGSFARMTGYGRDSLVSMRYHDIVTDKWRGREDRIRKEAVKHGLPATCEQELRRADGSLATVELLLCPVTGDRGEPAGFWNMARETGDWKRFEAMWKRYEAIVNTSFDFMLFINRDYRCEAINDAFCISLNVRRDDVIGRGVGELIGGDFFLHEIKPFVDTCFTGNAIYHQGLFVVGNLGERYMDIGFYPYHTGDEITHAIMTAHDITDLIRTEMQLQKSKAGLEERVADRTRDLNEMNNILESEILIREQAESELRKSEEKYRQLVETMTDGLFILQKDATVAYVNSRMSEMLGYEPGEMIGRPVYDFLNKNNHSIMKEELVKRRRGGKPQYEIEWVRKNGRRLQTFVSPQILSDEDGKFAGSFGVIKDITARKAAEAELKRAKDQAEKASRSKSEFLANISHEIRTPMNAILGFSELLESRISDEIHREYLTAIINSGRTLLGLINDILDLSKIEAGKFSFELSPINLRGVIREMESIFSRNLKEKNLRFFTSIDASVPESVNLDGIRIRQVLFNLIGNAVKFTAEGFIRVEASAAPAGGGENAVHLSISVQDTGIGIPEDQRDIIFEPFRQKDGQIQSHFGGSGLGLTITRKLVEAMGGGLSLVSEEGAGSTFIVTLNDVDLMPAEPAAVKRIAADRGRYDFKGKKVLVVDDVESNRVLFRVYLKSAGAAVLEAESGEEALKLVMEHRPDLILMDIVMPGMGGDEVLRALKDDPELSIIPVIAITASSFSERGDMVRGLCEGYLVKPVSRTDLFREIARFLMYDAAAFPGADTVEEDGRFDVLPDLESLLKGSLFKRWEEVRRRVVFDEIEDFAFDVMDVGVRYGARPLIDWSGALLRAARSFNMDALPELLGRYEDIVAAGMVKKPLNDHGGGQMERHEEKER